MFRNTRLRQRTNEKLPALSQQNSLQQMQNSLLPGTLQEQNPQSHDLQRAENSFSPPNSRFAAPAVQTEKTVDIKNTGI
ncbi:MAG: hypothetical protein PWR01_4744 [Clostridiales bacterium]|jgi:hypothetical protein|nr:hypothetical protein [Clostridiales bacterium]MDN5283671.1 hypothetical protein [Candidatus Ozemobacter sp.]